MLCSLLIVPFPASFLPSLPQVATKKHVSVAEVAASVVATVGPKSSGTVAEACRHYDDKVFGAKRIC